MKLIFPKKKRGLSTLVVTILIVSLVLVALGIVWQIVAGVLESSKEDVSFGQSKINLKLSSVFIESSLLSLKVSRLTGPGEMDGLKFIFSDGKNSEDIDETVPLEELEEKTFSLSLSKLDYEKLKTVSVAPMITLPSGKKRVGNILDTYTIRPENYDPEDYGDIPLEEGEEESENGGEEDFCTTDLDCPYEEEGSAECIDGNISVHFTVYSCDVLGMCVSNDVTRLFEYCFSGCYTENATCIGSSSLVCSEDSGCSEDGALGVPFCEEISSDIYQNYIDYSCVSGFCSNKIVPQMVQDCEDRGCPLELIPGECNPGPECVSDSDCEPDSFIEESEQCIGNEVWIDWKDNFCSENVCSNSITQFPKEEGDCSEKEGEWICFEGECMEYIECTEDEHCNLGDACGRICFNGACIVEVPTNPGVVSSIWPFGMGEYFDSPDIPTRDFEDYFLGNFVKFTSGNEGRCLLVKEHVYPTPPGVNAYLRFDVKTTAIAPGDSYEIWKLKLNCECTNPS